MANAVPGILAKIALIQKEVGTIPKNGRGPASKGSFEYVKYEDILNKVRDLQIEHGVITRFRTLEHNVLAEQVGNRMVVSTNVLVEYTYIDTEDGSEHVSVVGGEGSDIGGDTATRKAYTQAQKVNLLHTFNIVTGEEIDSDGAEQAELPSAEAPQSGAKPQSKTEETIEKLRAEIKAKYIDNAESPYDGPMVNALAAKVTGRAEPGGTNGWFGHAPSLKKLIKALEGGETA